MSKISSMIESLQLRNLPLSLSGVCLGILLAASDYKVSIATAVFTILTAVLMHILSSGSYGLRKWFMGASALLCTVFGLLTIKSSFGSIFSLDGICLITLGASVIMGARKYMSDLFAFLFLGIVTVMGAYFVASHAMPWWLLLPASAIGCFSVASMKLSRISKDGPETSERIWQSGLIVLGWGLMVAFCCVRFFDPWHYLFVLALPFYIIYLIGIWNGRKVDCEKLQRLLKAATAVLSILAGIGYIQFLLVA